MSDTEPLPALAQRLRSDLPLFVLIDPLLGDLLPSDEITANLDRQALEAIRSRVWLRPVHGIDLHEDLTLDSAYAPYLVELQGVDDPLVLQTFELAWAECQEAHEEGLAGSGTATRKVGGWLQTSLSGPALAQVLSQWMRLDTAARTGARYLRLGDNRVLDLLTHVVGEGALVRRLGRVTQWSYFNPLGHWRQLRSADDDDQPARPIRLNAAQWEQMALGAMLHPAVAQAHGQRAMDAGAIPPAPQVVDYAGALAAAAHWQPTPRKLPRELAESLLSEADHVSAVALSLLHGDWTASADAIDVMRQAHQDNQQVTALRYCSAEIHARLLAGQRRAANAYHDKPLDKNQIQRSRT